MSLLVLARLKCLKKVLEMRWRTRPELYRSVRRFSRLRLSDKVLFLEALVLLSAAAAATRLLPFSRISSLATRPIRGLRKTSNDDELQIAARIRWAVITGARFASNARCLQQAIVAQSMLRRRGVPSTLYYGVAPNSSGISAHAWLRAAGDDIVGVESAADFAVLAAFTIEYVQPKSQHSGL